MVNDLDERRGRFTDDEESRIATRREMVLGASFFSLHQTFGWCSPEECEKLAGKS